MISPLTSNGVVSKFEEKTFSRKSNGPSETPQKPASKAEKQNSSITTLKIKTPKKTIDIKPIEETVIETLNSSSSLYKGS